MTFLPIVDRELRQRARHRNTYWVRVWVAALAVLVGIVAYVVSALDPSLKLGTILFWGLSAILMPFCLLVGRGSTADSLSREKREGTLGLLFLTDLKGYDVVLGKVVATSVAALFGLLAVFPVMAIPLLAGGMTNGEFWRMVLVLVNTFFLSLAIGIFASAISREYQGAMAANFFLFALLVGAPAACGIVWSAVLAHKFVATFFYSCPPFSFFLVADTQYARMAGDFWWSVALTDGLAWVLVLLACWIVPRSWGDKPAPAPEKKWHWRQALEFVSYGARAKRAPFRKTALEANAFFWLASRARLKPAQVWWFLALACAWWINGWLDMGRLWLDEATYWTTALLLNSTLKLWITHEAGQRLGEDRRSGAFELLLATPLTVADILRGQWLALRRQFLKPVLVVIAVELVFVAALWRLPNSRDTFDMMIAVIIALPADSAALIWVAMAAALTERSQTRAATVAVARVLVLPCVAFAVIVLLRQFIYWFALINPLPGRWGPLLWLGLGLLADLFFGVRAGRRLRSQFRRLAVEPVMPGSARPPWWTLPKRAAVWMITFPGRHVPARARKPALAALAAGLALAAVFFERRARPHFPPPMTVSITQSNGPVRIFRAVPYGVFFILPDGSLWRWGQTGVNQSVRAATPQRIGAGHDWVKAVGTGSHFVGLRADGTVWEWGFRFGQGAAADPQLSLPGHDWIDIGAGAQHTVALRKDGTLWAWGDGSNGKFGNGQTSQSVPLGPFIPMPGRPSRPMPMPGSTPNQMVRVGTASNWTAVYCDWSWTLALRSDGTLWEWGQVFGMSGQRNVPVPTLVCAESNWVELDATGRVRNRAGELWDTGNTLPNRQATAAMVLHLVSSNSVSDHLADRRADWVARWDMRTTRFGLTADGQLWEWGSDLGGESVVTFQQRLHIARDRLSGKRSPGAPVGLLGIPPYSEVPRPLFQLITTPPP